LSFEGRGGIHFALHLSTPSFELPTEVYFLVLLTCLFTRKKWASSPEWIVSTARSNSLILNRVRGI